MQGSSELSIKMEIKKIFNTSEEKIESKKHNIFIPICLGNKFFSNKGLISEKFKEYLKWALENTKEKVLIVIPDKIQLTNYMVRISNNTEHQNLRRVLRCGLEIRKGVEEMISNLPKQAQNKIKIVNWEEYEKEDSICGLTTRLVYNEFKNNKEFRSAILKTIKTTLTDRKFSEAQYWKLSDYILDEFSICYHGVIYQDDYYRMFIYPFSDSTVYFLEDIKQNKIFKKLEKRLPKEKVAMVIIN